jgi:hypothetical protein
MRSHILRFSCIALALVGPLAAAEKGVSIVEAGGNLRVEIDGALFTVYHPTGARRPYFHPIIGPTGKLMVRNWPEKEAPGEERDHIHHRGLWFGHHAVNGVSFWDDVEAGGRQVHEKFGAIRSGTVAGGFSEAVKWVDKDGKEICRDERTIHIRKAPLGRIIDIEVTMTATQGDLVFGDDTDGLVALRVAETMRLKIPNDLNNRKAGKRPGLGHIVNSEGVRDDATWGKRAAWCDYSGPVEGEVVGVAIFDHPQNLRYPTWWHVRDYGLFAANPFGKRHFEKLEDRKAGEYILAAGQRITFRYRIYFHAGNEDEGRVAAAYAEYASTAQKP